MAELPEEVVDEAARLSRLARAAVDAAEAEAYRRERARLLDEYGYAARVRADETEAVLVCYPTDWLTEGTVDTDRIQDLDRAVERRLSGAGDPDDWDAIDAHNREIAAAVADEHGPVHGANAEAFADFMGNHYARRLETADRRECREFLTEYLPRNAWPTEAQLAVAPRSIERAFEAAGTEPPAGLLDEPARSQEERDGAADRR